MIFYAKKKRLQKIEKCLEKTPRRFSLAIIPISYSHNRYLTELKLCTVLSTILFFPYMLKLEKSQYLNFIFQLNFTKYEKKVMIQNF